MDVYVCMYMYVCMYVHVCIILRHTRITYIIFHWPPDQIYILFLSECLENVCDVETQHKPHKIFRYFVHA